jgi:hypothetical protein
MGNIPKYQNDPIPKPSLHHHRYLLEIRHREIILDFTSKTKLTIGDVLSFPSGGGFDGLHLWDCNIVLARYVVLNK